MLGLVVPVLAAVGVGIAVGGSFAGWAHVRLHWWPAALMSLLLLLVLFNPPLDHEAWAIQWGPWLFVGTHALLLATMVRNACVRSSSFGLRAAFGLAALGVASNLLVVVANGGYMPQSVEAHRAVWGTDRADTPGQPISQLKNTSVMTSDTRLPFLADVIAQPAWLPKANVVSVGDLGLALGLACWSFQVTTARRRCATEPQKLEA
jgi:hypothetical protein